MMPTKIEWTDEVWNPVTGCSKVSKGCKNCYAERIAERFWGDRKFTDVQCHPERLNIPLKWRKPRRVFVNSMSDLFHEDVSLAFIWHVFSVMKQTPQHTYQILTKRPGSMYESLKTIKFVLPNVWLGVSVENQETADERIPWLLKTPAAVRFVSYEPALGPVYIESYLYRQDTNTFGRGLRTGDFSEHLGNRLDWVIAGGESGPGARPAHPDWFRSVRDQCVDAKVPFFFKQWGEWIPVFETEWIRVHREEKGMYERVGKKRAGRLLDGREWNEFPISEAIMPEYEEGE